ncbi:MAG: non-canonical purine NTP pyrophosphatase, partial [Myxococcales bacterium]
MRIHVGTGNPGKLREYREILAPLGHEVVAVVAPEPAEPEPDLEGNA